MNDRCFACGRVLGSAPKLVDTRDGQRVYVGKECFKKLVVSGVAGWQPTKGGPRLFLVEKIGGAE